ncbi:MAG: hypothetical protein ACOVP4_04580 [Bacteriovoracaceae bacterium]
MEKHIIFLYPLHPVIQELKDALEKEGGYDIYEIDDANEYRQLVGVIGQSITLTSDVRKIHSTIDAQAQLVKSGMSKVIIMGKIQNHPQEVNQLRVLGVQELLTESTPLKSVQFKINLFLKGFEAQEIQKQKDIVQETKKNKKNEAKKHLPLVVGNPLEDNMRLENKEPLQEQKTQFDFKGFVRNEKKPFSVKSIDGLKEKKFSRPIFTEEQRQQKIKNKKYQGIIFEEIPLEDIEASTDDLSDEESDYKKKSYRSHRLTGELEGKKSSATLRLDVQEEIMPIEDEVSDGEGDYRKKTYKSHRLTEEVDKKKTHSILSFEENLENTEKDPLEKEQEKEKLLARKKDLEEAADLIRKTREDLRLGQEEEKKISTPLRLGIEGKKYFAFHIDDEKSGKEKHKDLRLDNQKEKFAAETMEIESKASKESGLSSESAKDWGEQTIDYADFDKENREGSSSPRGSTPQMAPVQEESAEELFLRYPDFYYPPSGISTFIPLLLEVLQIRPFDQNKFMQFLCFMFQKKLEAKLTYILERDDQVTILGSTFLIGNKDWDSQEVYKKSKLEQFKGIIVPTWSDETFQDSVLTFVFPFYFNKQRMGLAHAIFDKGTVRNHQEALEVELLIVMARTVYLKEFGY